MYKSETTIRIIKGNSSKFSKEEIPKKTKAWTAFGVFLSSIFLSIWLTCWIPMILPKHSWWVPPLGWTIGITMVSIIIGSIIYLVSLIET
jgi:hypothetical protein